MCVNFADICQFLFRDKGYSTFQNIQRDMGYQGPPSGASIFGPTQFIYGTYHRPAATAQTSLRIRMRSLARARAFASRIHTVKSF